jgi:predicted dienelactone hydrolase
VKSRKQPGVLKEKVMRRLCPLLICFCAAWVAAPSVEAATGFAKISLNSQSGRPVEVHLWYPTEAQSAATSIGDSPVFEGVDGVVDASIADGRFPLVLISHGGMRSAPGQANWLGAYLASKGYVAAIANSTRLGPRDARQAPDEIWRRPGDLLSVLTLLSKDPTWSPHIDNDKIAAVGFFLGGTSGLMLAGGRIDPDLYAASCDGEGISVDCAWYADLGVDPHDFDSAQLSVARMSQLVKVLVVFDPELGGVFASDSLQAINIPVTILNLGPAESVHPALRADALAARIPGARYDSLSGATHFSAFAVCNPNGAAILVEDGDDGALCMEPDGVSRAAVHELLGARVVESVAAAFQH